MSQDLGSYASLQRISACAVSSHLLWGKTFVLNTRAVNIMQNTSQCTTQPWLLAPHLLVWTCQLTPCEPCFVCEETPGTQGQGRSQRAARMWIGKAMGPSLQGALGSSPPRRQHVARGHAGGPGLPVHPCPVNTGLERTPMAVWMGLPRLWSVTVGSGLCSGRVRNVMAAVGHGIHFLCPWPRKQN